MTKNIKILIGLVFTLFLLGIYPFYQYINRYNIDDGIYYLAHHSLNLPSDWDKDWKSMVKEEFTAQFNHLSQTTLITKKGRDITINNAVDTEHTRLNIDNTFYFDGSFTLKRSLFGQIIMESFDQSIIFHLAPAEMNVHMAETIKKNISAKQDKLTDNIDQFAQLIKDQQLLKDFIGIPKALNNDNKIKLPLTGEYKLFPQFGGIFIHTIAGVQINNSDENTTIYHLSSKNSSDSSYIAIIPAPKDTINFIDSLSKDRIVFQEDNGVIFATPDQNYTAIYIHYDEKNNQYILAQYEDRTGYIENITEMYSIFRTLSPAHKGETLSLDTLALTPKEFKTKYKIDIDQAFSSLKFFHEMQTMLDRTVNSIMRYTSIYTEDGNSIWAGFNLSGLDLTNANTFPINKVVFVHYTPKAEVFQKFQQRDPNGKIKHNAFIWSEPTKKQQYSLLTEDNGITYEIRLGQYDSEDGDGSADELYLLIALDMLLKKHTPFGINRNTDITNAGRHPVYTNTIDASLSVFPIKNGIINAKGELLVSIDEIYHVTYPAQRYLQINHHYLVDNKGTLLLNNQSFSHLSDDTFIISDPKTPKNYGVYDFAKKKWLIDAQYEYYERNGNILSFNRPDDSWTADIYLDTLKYLGEAYHVKNIPSTQQVMLHIGKPRGDKSFKLFDHQGKLIKEIDEDLGYASYSPKAQLYIMTIFKDGKRQYIPMTLQGRLYNDIYNEYHIDNDRIFVKKANEDVFNELRQ